MKTVLKREKKYWSFIFEFKIKELQKLFQKNHVFLVLRLLIKPNFGLFLIFHPFKYSFEVLKDFLVTHSVVL